VEGVFSSINVGLGAALRGPRDSSAGVVACWSADFQSAGTAQRAIPTLGNRAGPKAKKEMQGSCNQPAGGIQCA